MKLYANGLGESLGGDPLAGQRPIYASGNVWWVNSATGTDAGGTAGQDQQKPLATIVQANTNASDGDVIVLQSGHTETLTVALSLKGLTVVGIGTTSGKPAAQIKINAAASTALQFATTGGQIHNVYFPASVQVNTTANGKLRLTTTGCAVYGCYFEASANDQLPQLSLDATGRIDGCTFVSTATSTASRPLKGLGSTGALADLIVVDCIFDDGSVGFTSPACDLSAAAVTRLRAWGNSLLRGAEASINSGSTGFFIPATTTLGAKVTW